MESNNWQKKTLIFSFIAIESFLLLISMIQPAFSSYFTFSNYHKSGFKKIQLSGKFKASDRNRQGKISAPKIESFKSNALYNDKHKRESIFLLDSIVFKKKLEFAQFKYNLTANHLEFFIRTHKKNLNPLINSVYSHGQINFKKELDNFLTDHNQIAGIDSEGTRRTQISSTALWEVDSLIIMLILSVVLFRVNQQIQNKPQLNQESQELDLSKTQSSKNKLFK